MITVYNVSALDLTNDMVCIMSKSEHLKVEQTPSDKKTKVNTA